MSKADDLPLRLAPTPSLPLGPFYPVLRLAPGRALWTSSERPRSGQLLALHGRVLDRAGQPLPGAQVEAWHADPHGRYPHPDQPGAEAVDARFAGYGTQVTDGQGAWRFASVMPGSYGVEARRRAPHIHFQVTHGATRLVTQMHFADHAMNPSDRWYRAVEWPERLLGRVKDDDAGGITVEWDIVMACSGARLACPTPLIEEP